MTRRAVLDDNRMATAWAAHVDRLVQWLGQNGFERLNGDRLPAWVTERIERHDAYGSVVVLPRGWTPVGLVAGPQKHPLWLQYLEVGGRIVHAGDLPFDYIQSPAVAPLPFEAQADLGGIQLLGIAWGWQSAFWGAPGAAQPTPAAAAWGLELADGAITGAAVASVTTAFHVFVAKNGEAGASDWFRNVDPQAPWSGLVKILQSYDGNRDAALRDIYRAALYVGQPIAIPSIAPLAAPPSPAFAIELSAGERRGRTEFVRGERVVVELRRLRSRGPEPQDSPGPEPQSVRLELLSRTGTSFDGGAGDLGTDFASAPLLTRTESLKADRASVTLDTSPFADGTYALVATLVAPGGGLEPSAPHSGVVLGIRELAWESAFPLTVLYSAGSEGVRNDLELDDVAQTGFGVLADTPDNAQLDRIVRHRMHFALRAMPERPTDGAELRAHPEYLRVGAGGKPFVLPGYSSPSVGLSHPNLVAKARDSIAAKVRAVAAVPALLPFVITNDDFSVEYGADYAPAVVAEYRKEAGRDPPMHATRPARFGPIADDDPSLSWTRFTLRHVDGAYNSAERAGAVSALPHVRIGPIPGGMMVPLSSLANATQYPTYSFDRDEFNLIAYYYYDWYWQPLLTNTFWLEFGRIGHRDLPEWTMPDVMGTAAYTRNTFFHDLAGGARGLSYFQYSVRNTDSWPELERLARTVRAIAPVQRALEPSGRDIGLLSAFSDSVFSDDSTVLQAYAFEAMTQAHFGVEVVSEDEILAGRGAPREVIVLDRIRYLARSVYDALARRAAAGGVVILDATIPFDVPGAKRIHVDLGRGTVEPSTLNPTQRAAIPSPQASDCGRQERIDAVRTALQAFVPPLFEGADLRLVASLFRAAGVDYTWFVNAQDGAEFSDAHARFTGPAASIERGALIARFAAEEARTLGEPYSASLSPMHPVGVPYDLTAGRELPVRVEGVPRPVVSLTMPRYGGSLVAWMPCRITSLSLAAKAVASPGAAFRAEASVRCGDEPAPGILPIDFVLKSPAGAVHALSGVRGAREGRASFEWTPAVNDAGGEWTLEARDLTAGHVVARTVRVGR